MASTKFNIYCFSFLASFSNFNFLFKLLISTEKNILSMIRSEAN